MALSNKKKTLLVVLATLVAGVVIWQTVKYRIIREKAPELLSRKTDGLYKVTYGNLHLDELAGTLEVDNVVIVPDSLVYARMIRNGECPSLLMEASVTSLKILGVSTPKALLGKKIDARAVEISGANIRLLTSRSQSEKNSKDPLRSIQDILLSKLESIRIDSVRLIHSSLSVRRMRDREPRFSLDSLSLTLDGFALDSLMAKDSTRVLFSNSLNARCKGLHIASASRRYDLQVEGLAYNSANDILSVDRLRLKPMLSEAAFAALMPVATDRYDFSLEDIRLLHLEKKALLENKISVDSLLIRRGSFRIYCDVSYPQNKASQQGKFPQQLLMKLPAKIAVRHITMASTYVEYKEKNAKSDSAGILRFVDGKTVITNLTNERSMLSRSDRCLVRYRGRFLDQVPMEVRLVLALGDPRGHFWAEGKLDSLYGPAINPMLEPMALVKVEKGTIQNFQFTLQGNDMGCSGRLTLAYKNANLAFLKWRKDRFATRLLPSIAIAGILRHSNPSGKGLPRTVRISRQRKDRDSFISFIWKTIFGGIRQTIAVK